MKDKAIERMLMILCSLACIVDGVCGLITLGTPKTGLALASATILARHRGKMEKKTKVRHFDRNRGNRRVR